MRIAQTSVIYTLTKVVGSLLGFLATVYFARILGEEVLGQYALILALVTWLGMAGKVGVNKAIIKRISEGADPREYAGAGLVIMSIIVSGISSLVLIFQRQINAYVGAPVAKYVVVLLIVVLYKTYINASLKGKHLVHVYAILSAIKDVLIAIIQVALVIVGFGLTGLLWGYTIGYLIAATIGFRILGLYPARPRRQHLINIFNYAKYS